MGNFGGDIVNALKHFMTGGNLAASQDEMNRFAGQGQGIIPGAQASQMPPTQPSTLGPLGGPLRSADTIGHGVPRASPGMAQDFMRKLFGQQALPQAGTRQQMFADFPKPGYNPTHRRY